MDQDTGIAYEFTNSWFEDTAKVYLSRFLPSFRPKRVLEIGSWEGRSTCYFIDTLSRLGESEIHCIDSFRGGWEHEASDMALIERRFHKNVNRAIKNAPYPTKVHLHKEKSDIALAKLLAGGMSEYFDFIYVDGSHELQDVVVDALFSFKLLRCGGVIGFDDFTWGTNSSDPFRSPKVAIDFFAFAHWQELKYLSVSLSQIYFQKQGV